MSSSHLEDPHDGSDEEAVMLDADEAEEEIERDDDAAMDSGEEGDGNDEQMYEEIELVNDSSAHFDLHKDSIFAIAQHPIHSHIVATGGSEGTDSEGMGYIFDSTPEATPVLPASYQSAPSERRPRKGLEPIFKMDGNRDSIAALTFTLPAGEYLVNGSQDGRVRTFSGSKDGRIWEFCGEVQEVEEVVWINACPNPDHPNTIALGSSDGSVWVYTIDRTNRETPMQIVQSYFLHTGSCTAGSWSADGKLLATVCQNGSLYVWDVFGHAAAAGLTQGKGGAYVVGLTAEDQRFEIEGGIYSVAVAPTGAFVVVGGAGGFMKVVGLPKLGDASTLSAKGAGKAKGGAKASAGQAGQILASLQPQVDGIETLSFSAPPLTLMASGSIDGSIAILDYARQWAVRRHIKQAHEESAVVKVDFVKGGGGYLLTSAAMDGVVRRWDTRGGTGMANMGLVKEWKGHKGDHEGFEEGGILGFVQDGGRIVTAGNDGVNLVFEAGA